MARSYITKAQALCENGEIATGMLWLARGLEEAPDDATEIQRAVLKGLFGWEQQLPTLRLIAQQEEPIRAIALSRDGQRLYTGDKEGRIRVYDGLSGHPIDQSFHHRSDIRSMALSSDDNYLVTTSYDGTARICNARTLDSLEEIDFVEADGEMWSVQTAAFSPDGEQAAVGGNCHDRRGKVIIKDVQTWQTLKTIYLPGGVERLRYTPQGLVAALRFPNGSEFQLWNVDTGQALGPKLIRGGAATNCLAISHDGNRLAVAGNRSHIKVWMATTGEQLNQFDSSGIIYSLEFDPSGTHLLSAGLDQAVRLWDVSTGKAVAMPLRHQKPVRIAAFSADHRKILTGTGAGESWRATANGTARVWDVAMQLPQERLIQHDNLRTVAFSPQGLRVFTVIPGPKRSFQMHDGESMAPIGKPLAGCTWMGNVQFNADGAKFAISGAGSKEDGTEGLQIRSGLTGELIASVRKHYGDIAMAFSPDGRYLLTGDQSGRVSMKDAETLEQIGPKIKLLPRTVSSVSFGPQGTRFLTGCFDGTLRVWDATTLTQLGDPIQHVSEVKCLAHHPSLNQAFVGCADGSARLWDLETRTPIGPSLQHKKVVCAVAYSPDGTQIVTCSTDGWIRLWDATTLDPAGPPIMHQGGWPHITFSPNGLRLASTHGEIWDLAPLYAKASPQDIREWTESVTGWELDNSGQVNILSAEQWSKARERLIERQVELPGLPRKSQFSRAGVHHAPSPEFVSAGLRAEQIVRDRLQEGILVTSDFASRRRLTELNSDTTTETAPWLSSDGLTIYWTVERWGNLDRSYGIWTAQRKDTDAKFENPIRLLPGRHATLTSDELEMMLLVDSSLCVAKRTSRDKPFSDPQPIDEFRSLTEAKTPAYSNNGLTVAFLKWGPQNIYFSTRPNRNAPWSEPSVIPLMERGVQWAQARGWPYYSPDQTHLWFWFANKLIYGSRESVAQPFGDLQVVHFDGEQVQGKSPRYFERTNELFYSAPSGPESRDGDLWVIKDFLPTDPTTTAGASNDPL